MDCIYFGYDCLPAASTKAHQLDGLAVRLEPAGAGGSGEGGIDVRIVKLDHGPALPADEVLPVMAGARIDASEKSVEGFEAVDQAHAQEEFQAAIDRRRSRGMTFLAQGFQQVVGADRRVGAQDQLQHPPAERGQPLAPGDADLFRRRKAIGDAGLMIMILQDGKQGFGSHAPSLSD